MTAPTHIVFSLLSAASAFSLASTPLHKDVPALGCAILGGILPDIDTPRSSVGRVAPFFSESIERRWGHRTVTHSLLALLGLGVAALPLMLYQEAWFAALVIGYAGHLVADCTTKSGVSLFYPHPAICVFPAGDRYRIHTGPLLGEGALLVVLLVLLAALMPVSRVGGIWRASCYLETGRHVRVDTLRVQGQTRIRDPFRDRSLSDGAVRTLGLLLGLDRGPSGCFARRETLARMRGVSLSSIEHQLGRLKQQGYITVTRKGRRPGEPAIIRVNPGVRAALGMDAPAGVRAGSLQDLADSDLQESTALQDVAGSEPRQSADLRGSADMQPQDVADLPLYKDEDRCFEDSETTDSYQENPYSGGPGRGTMRAVVAQNAEDTGSRSPGTDADATSRAEGDAGVRDALQELAGVGMGQQAAEALVRNYPARQIRAAIRYVLGSRSAVLNPPGYIRFVLEANLKIPEGCFPREERQPAPDAPPPSLPAQVMEPDPDREQRREVSPYAPMWRKALERIRQQIMPESFDRWIAPLFVADITGGKVLLDAPHPSVADWVTEHYLWIIRPARAILGRLPHRAGLPEHPGQEREVCEVPGGRRGPESRRPQ